MKKYYTGLTIKIIVLFLVVLILGCGALTYQKAESIRETYIREINGNTDYIVPLRQNISDGKTGDIVLQVYEILYQKPEAMDGVGFYCMLKDVEGNTLAEEQNFIFLQRLTDEEKTDHRVLLLGDQLISDNRAHITNLENQVFCEMTVTGTCDDTFVYLDKLEWSYKREMTLS